MTGVMVGLIVAAAVGLAVAVWLLLAAWRERRRLARLDAPLWPASAPARGRASVNRPAWDDGRHRR